MFSAMLLVGLNTASFFNMLLICTACHFEGNEKYLDLPVVLSDNLDKSELNFIIIIIITFFFNFVQ